MKILRIIASMNPAHGGPAQGIRNTIPALATLGVQNEVVCCDAESDPWVKSDSFPVHAVGRGKFGFSYSADLSAWLCVHLLRFDAVIVHGLWLWPGWAALRAMNNLDKSAPRYFVMPHGMLDPWFQRDSSRLIKSIRNLFYWWLVERHVVNSAEGLLFTCEEELKLARTTFGGYHPKRELNVGYGIAAPPPFDTQMREAFLFRCPELAQRPYLLFLGRIHPKKGVDILIQAYLQDKSSGETQLDLVIAGPGWDSAYGREMKRLIETSPRSTRGSRRIHAVDMLAGFSKWGALYDCEAFILPSHQENFGIAVVEALACNKPVLISNKVNIWREIAEDHACLVENDSLEGALQLLNLFSLNKLKPRNASEAERFRQCYLQRFTNAVAAKNLSNVIGNILRKNV